MHPYKLPCVSIISQRKVRFFVWLRYFSCVTAIFELGMSRQFMPPYTTVCKDFTSFVLPAYYLWQKTHCIPNMTNKIAVDFSVDGYFLTCFYSLTITPMRCSLAIFHTAKLISSHFLCIHHNLSKQAIPLRFWVVKGDPQYAFRIREHTTFFYLPRDVSPLP